MPGGSTLRCLVILLLLVLSPLTSQAADTLTFCYEDKDSYPWVMTDHTGLNLELLILVAAASQLQIRYVAAPWKRCLAGLARGRYDGAFASSFKAERLSMGRYPTDSDGRLDESKRLHTSVYALYRRRGSSVGWNGTEFRHLTSAIGSLSGFPSAIFYAATAPRWMSPVAIRWPCCACSRSNGSMRLRCKACVPISSCRGIRCWRWISKKPSYRWKRRPIT